MTNPAITPATTLKALQLFQQGQQLRAEKQLAQAAAAFRKATEDAVCKMADKLRGVLPKRSKPA